MNWDTLQQHYSSYDVDWAKLCEQPGRSQQCSRVAAGLRLDWSREHVTQPAWEALLALAEQREVAQHRQRQWQGDLVNCTENRAVLHGALRSPERGPASVATDIQAQEQALEDLVARLNREQPDHAVLHIGIGGSDLGPRLAAEVAGMVQEPQRSLYFLNNLDDASVRRTLRRLDPRRTLVVVVSKSFGTAETRALMERCTHWLGEAQVDPAHALIAVTAKTSAAVDAGVSPQRVLLLPEWVGGRYSLWSAVSLSLALAYGCAARQQLRAGAQAMDTHFLDAPMGDNLPVLGALVGLWQRNVQQYNTRVVVPYADALRLLPEYLQQLEMESNGKSVDAQGRPLSHATAPATFGGVGSCVQHAFFQLLHQSQDVHPVEFVLPAVLPDVPAQLQQTLTAHCLAQACALTQGRTASGDDQSRRCPGGRPSSLLQLARLDLWHLGALLAYYEHRTAVQGWIWGINSYDQFGVEIGKKIAAEVEPALAGEADYPDAVAAAAGAWYRRCQEHSA
nr:glucose-6-phosphate isomerase [Oceanococcus sp. HetDA_MAG_MS8]